MKNKFVVYNCILGLCLLFITHLQSSERRKIAQTGFQFLSVTSDARAAAMGGAVNTIKMGSSSLFFNPALMAEMSSFIDLSFSKNQWIADIDHLTASLALKPSGGKYGVLGFSVQQTNYGDLQGTRVAENEQGYAETGLFNPTASAFGLGYAKQITAMFSVGGQIKTAYQNLGNAVLPVAESDSLTEDVSNDLTPMSLDFGTYFKTGIKSLVFGMSVKHFSKEVKYAQEGFQLPLVFTLGISMNLIDLWDEESELHKLWCSIDATHYRSHAEQLLIGVDYSFMDLLNLRGGLVSGNDEDKFSFGFGVSHFGAAFDFAYTPFGVFGDIKRMTVRFCF